MCDLGISQERNILFFASSFLEAMYMKRHCLKQNHKRKNVFVGPKTGTPNLPQLEAAIVFLILPLFGDWLLIDPDDRFGYLRIQHWIIMGYDNRHFYEALLDSRSAILSIGRKFTPTCHKENPLIKVIFGDNNQIYHSHLRHIMHLSTHTPSLAFIT